MDNGYHWAPGKLVSPVCINIAGVGYSGAALLPERYSRVIKTWPRHELSRLRRDSRCIRLFNDCDLCSCLLPQGTVNVYYEAAAVIVALILLGRFMEARAKGRTSEAIKRLVGLQAKEAHVLRNGIVIDIPISDVALDDIIEVRPVSGYLLMVR